MDIYKSLFWHQGLLLQPQHFQLAELSHHSMLEPYRKFLQSYFWGVAKLDVSPGGLANLSFDMVSGEFIFPGGTYVRYPGNGYFISRSFESDWTDRDRPLKVFLGLKKYDPVRANVTVIENPDGLNSINSRFITSAEPEDVKDLHANGPDGQVQHLDYVLKLFWANEVDQAGDYECIPVAELEMQGAEIGLRNNYIPPSLSVLNPVSLLKIVKNIRDLLAGRSRQLEEFKARRGLHTSDFGSRDMVFLLALRSLNRYVPLLFHATEHVGIHPWHVYGLLRQLIGELSTFSVDYNAVGECSGAESSLPEYQHENLGECFTTAEAIIIRLVDEITAGPEYVLPLLYDGTYFTTEMPPALFDGRNRFFLVVETEADPESTIAHLEGIAKFGSRESLPLLIARALPGVGVEQLSVPPQELPRRSHSLYFQIDSFSDEWMNVQQMKNFALYWDQAPEDFKIELMVVGRDS